MSGFRISHSASDRSLGYGFLLTPPIMPERGWMCSLYITSETPSNTEPQTANPLPAHSRRTRRELLHLLCCSFDRPSYHLVKPNQTLSLPAAAVAVEGAVTHPLPAQIPACGFPAPGSSDSLASATRHVSGVYAFPRSEVGLVDPALHVRTRFPLRATAACQPLPHVNGPTVSEYYGLIRLPGNRRLLYLSFRIRLPELCPGATRVSQVPGASLHASHALCGPRQTLRALTRFSALFVLASGPLTPSPSALEAFAP